MGQRQLPPVVAVISFIDCINRGAADGLGLLMTDDHELVVFDEEALRGKTANVAAWKGYAAACGPFPSELRPAHRSACPGHDQPEPAGDG